VIYASQPPLMNKAYDMDGQRVSPYHPGTASVTLSNRTARCWNGDRDELRLWEDKTFRQVCVCVCVCVCVRACVYAHTHNIYIHTLYIYVYRSALGAFGMVKSARRQATAEAHILKSPLYGDFIQELH
jgi:hypothetical protein